MKYLDIFEKYTNSYDLTDHKLKMKYEHSKSVADICEDIAKHENLDTDISYLCGLFHDIGRFEQLKLYDTFWDSKSVDHGDLGSMIIQDIIGEDIEILKYCIKFHNKFILPSLDSDIEKYVRLVRDADKVDIFRVYFEYYKDDTNIDFAKGEDVSDIIVDKILNQECVNYNIINNTVDFRCIKFSWMYDINYKRSLDIIRENNYIDRLYDSLPHTEKINKIYEKIKKSPNR